MLDSSWFIFLSAGSGMTILDMLTDFCVCVSGSVLMVLLFILWVFLEYNGAFIVFFEFLNGSVTVY